MRSFMLICCALSSLAACAPDGTELVIDSPGQPGAVVSYDGRSVTLDASGHGVLRVGRLHSVESGFGNQSDVAIVDAMDRRIVLRFESGGHAIELSPYCVPYLTEGGPIESANLRLRRVVADGSCRLVNPSLVSAGTEQTGTYDPTLFDDAPCGPFATGD